MTLIDYYHIILHHFQQGKYHIHPKTRELPITPNFHLETINYMMFEYLKEKYKDNTKAKSRYSTLFDYVLIPTKHKTDDIFDFSNIEFQDFFDFLVSIKEPNNKKKKESVDDFWQ